jgi:hypothetical protein
MTKAHIQNELAVSQTVIASLTAELENAKAELSLLGDSYLALAGHNHLPRPLQGAGFRDEHGSPVLGIRYSRAAEGVAAFHFGTTRVPLWNRKSLDKTEQW